ncbi:MULTISPECIES: 6,7-dimethyl-8-ribityllumazine synthase [Inquilinus]|uniref:6,7-dimethyl-8-ribityllumazine synthase n=1 Tax=Inquilinus ginsengisoli TaxID=363840 RepID=A0ABU1JRK7_9PROT|nr:6,7-dimethyl-8-ribityllumazine synthase [Inquilinus ginsengisoli]MDR6291232.1 6,7-dimethyl-8-ribityllumazine synthase [Inquilinus ginsengisoli]
MVAKTETRPVSFSGPAPHIMIVEARFYEDITDELARGVVAVLEQVGATWERVAVPGALEIPAAVQIAAASGHRFDGYVALGCVIRGETSHYDTVCNESARGLQDLALRHGLAIGNGILTVETEAQAWARAKVDEMDKGGGAARAALAMIELKRRFQQGQR